MDSKTLASIAQRAGLELVAVVGKPRVQEVLSRGSKRLGIWQERGYAAEMEYMKRSTALFSDIEHLMPEVRSVLCFLVSYNHGEALENPPAGYGRIARYAWGRDYHRVLKKRLRHFVAIAGAELGEQEIRWRSFSDAVPLLERALGVEAELGFHGKNTMLIRPGLGSYSFIAEILWNLEVEEFSAKPATITDCGTCERCLAACPTNAFAGPRVMNAGKCISYLTIEKKSSFDEWEKQAIGDWLFGCDICQDVCPFNHESVVRSSVEEFSQEQGVGPFLSIDDLLAVRSREEFLSRFAGTALMRAGREKMLRNAACVAANSRFFETIERLREALESDPSSMVREHAMWALAKLSADSSGLDRKRIRAALA